MEMESLARLLLFDSPESQNCCGAGKKTAGMRGKKKGPPKRAR